MSKKVYCVAQFQPKAGKADELFKVLQGLEPNTLREDGLRNIYLGHTTIEEVLKYT